MIPLAEARSYVLDRVTALPPQRISLDQVLGLVLAEPVTAVDPVPAFANTAMDGFALRAADTADAPVELEVIGTIAAGDTGDRHIGTGQAARIMTGAPMPPGADAVVMVERTRPSIRGDAVSGRDRAGDGEGVGVSAGHGVGRGAGDGVGGRTSEGVGGGAGDGVGGRTGDGVSGGVGDRVIVTVSVAPGNHVRYPGEDLAAGEAVFDSGTYVSAGCVGVLAGIGAYEVSAYPRPRVGVLSTGDELVDEPGALRHGQIRDTNRRALLGLLAESGFEGVDLGIATDNVTDIERAFREGASRCDALLSSGGVSMGDYDYVKVVLDRIGAMRWMQIAIKPAKPFAFGIVDDTPVFGLPGNPVSSMVSYELLAKPALRAMAGWPSADLGPALVPAVSRDSLGRGVDGKTHYLRVGVSRDERGVLQATSSGGQGSHQLTAMARADALAVIPDGIQIGAGDPVQVILL